MFTQLRAAYQAGRHAQHEEGATSGISVRDVLRMATLDDARFLGLAGRKGSLTPGTQADLVLRADRPDPAPVHGAGCRWPRRGTCPTSQVVVGRGGLDGLEGGFCVVLPPAQGIGVRGPERRVADPHPERPTQSRVRRVGDLLGQPRGDDGQVDPVAAEVGAQVVHVDDVRAVLGASIPLVDPDRLGTAEKPRAPHQAPPLPPRTQQVPSPTRQPPNRRRWHSCLAPPGRRNVTIQLVRGWSGSRAVTRRTRSQGCSMVTDSDGMAGAPGGVKLPPGAQLQALEVC
ncbi:amidohydrolase family protein [Streptomyces sp. NPDC059929]|uniref:amidohydrolase family protein n=1 Tax=Streptomyces sp. NPDC059929 TaxID=3347008 RepID=UPI00365A0B21